MVQSGNAMYKTAKELGLHRKFEFKDQDFIGTHDGCTSTYAYTSIKELYETKIKKIRKYPARDTYGGKRPRGFTVNIKRG